MSLTKSEQKQLSDLTAAICVALRATRLQTTLEVAKRLEEEYLDGKNVYEDWEPTRSSSLHSAGKG